MGPIVLYIHAKNGKILKAVLERRPKTSHIRMDGMTDGRNGGQMDGHWSIDRTNL